MEWALAGERVPAADAIMLLDGPPAARTSLDGSLVLRAPARPSVIEVRWGAQGASGPFDEVCLRRRSHLHVVLLDEGAGR